MSIRISKFFIVLNLFFLSWYSFAADYSFQANILLNRFTYGPRAGEIEALANSGKDGIKSWINHQLGRDLPEEKVLSDSLLKLKSTQMSNEEILRKYSPKDYLQKVYAEFPAGTEGAANELILQKTLKAVYGKNQFEEMMLDFWFNHFNVDANFTDIRFFVTTYEREALRPNIFGSFGDLLIAASKSPAMLRYFGQNNSQKGHVVENYSREVLELYTMGVGGGYTQEDVENVARIFTGWNLEGKKTYGIFKFKPELHDENPKSALGINFKNEGLAEGERFLRHLAGLRQTSQFIAKKLVSRFISEEPSTDDVNRIADVFYKTGGNLSAVYRELLNVDALNPKNVGVKYKTPYEFAISAMRAIDAKVIADPSKMKEFLAFLDLTKNKPYHCWPPTGYKSKAEYWVNPAALVARLNFAASLSRNQTSLFKVDFSKSISPSENFHLKTIGDELQYLNRHMFNGVISAESLLKISKLLESEKKEIKPKGVRAEIISLALASAEFQRR